MRYERGEFEDVLAMNEAIIKAWDEKVNSKDIVYHLGDVGINGQENLEDIMKQLPGQKCLVLGNHDLVHPYEYWLDIGFCRVYEHPICIHEFYWLSHAPMYLNQNMPYVNIHGHIHRNIIFTPGTKNQYVNVSVEHQLPNGPMEWKEIQEYFSGKKEKK